MAKRFKFDSYVNEHGERRVVFLINCFGQAHVANDAGVTQSTVSQWLQRKNYSRRTTWVKDRKQGVQP